MVPPRRHILNLLESKHGITRSIFLKLSAAEPESKQELLAICAVAISNDHYGNDVMSSFELAKGSTKPVADGSVKLISGDFIDAEERLQSKRKMAFILKSKSTKELNITARDMIEIFNKTGMGKTGTWCAPKNVLAIDVQGKFVTQQAKNEKRATAAFENILAALPEDSFAQVTQEAIDTVDEIKETASENLKGDGNCETIDIKTDNSTVLHSDADFFR